MHPQRTHMEDQQQDKGMQLPFPVTLNKGTPCREDQYMTLQSLLLQISRLQAPHKSSLVHYGYQCTSHVPTSTGTQPEAVAAAAGECRCQAGTLEVCSRRVRRLTQHEAEESPREQSHLHCLAASPPVGWDPPPSPSLLCSAPQDVRIST